MSFSACRIVCRLFMVIGLAAGLPSRGVAGEVLYNGIELPDLWPPRLETLPRDPVAPAYLASPPKVIPIDVGRQLFVDDFLIQESNLKRVYHQADYFPENPVLKPEKPWETATGVNTSSMVFSDGVWHDPADSLFKIWYMGGYTASTCYATSEDGIHWQRPELDVVAGTNTVDTSRRDSGAVWLDLATTDPQQRFKMALSTGSQLVLCASPDGVHWGAKVGSGPTGDRSTIFFNPFRNRWVYSIRAHIPGDPRVRRYWESADFLTGANWKSMEEPTLWTSADNLDPPREDLKTPPQLYNLDCAAYESLMLGLFTIWRGQPSDRAKPNEVCLGFSRDGFHWHRPERKAFIPVSEKHGDWNWGNVQSAGGGCLVVGDKLYFYVSGRAGQRGSAASGACATGLATLRRDGFASLEAGADGGTVTTRPLSFKGRHVFVNAQAGGGEIRLELLDTDGKAIAPFTLENCEPLRADETLQAVRWKGAKDVATVANMPVRIRFHVKSAKLYSFWVSPDESGASHGYVAAGGPGFTSPIDNVGRGAAAGGK